MVAHACNPSPGESDAGRLPGVLNQIELQSETMPKKKKINLKTMFHFYQKCIVWKTILKSDLISFDNKIPESDTGVKAERSEM